MEEDNLGSCNLHLDNASILSVAGAPLTNDVYFGTNPRPGPAELLGHTTHASWNLPQLSPLTTYYWQIVAHRVGPTPGPVWQFTTKGVDHFDWSAIASPQLVGKPFAATVTARDEFGSVVSNFNGTGSLEARGSGGSLPAGSVVPYFTDHDSSATGPEGPSSQAGFAPLPVTDISALDLNQYEMLFLDEADHGFLSSALQARLADIQDWVNHGGRLIVRDRSAGNISPNPFLLGTVGITTVRLGTSDIDVIPPGLNLVVSGPFGTVTNTTLEGGNSSAHGDVPQNQLPPSASAFLSIGSNTSEVVAFSYPVGSGQVYYSSIPLDCYLEGGGCGDNVIADPLQHIYTPNVLRYVSSGGRTPVAIPPTNSGNFVNGTWTGNLTVLQPATNLTLVASDSGGHRGESNPFDVLVENDLVIRITDLPDPVAVGTPLTNVITGLHSGPAAATDVTVTNLLPATAAFLSATASQETFASAAGTVRWNLGTLPGGTSATLAVVSQPTAPGLITNWAFVGRAGPDGYDGNNAAASITTELTPRFPLPMFPVQKATAASRTPPSKSPSIRRRCAPCWWRSRRAAAARPPGAITSPPMAR